jgi:hypothetical protein
LWSIPWRELIQMIPGFPEGRGRIPGWQGRTYLQWVECHQVCSGCRLECLHHGLILPNCHDPGFYQFLGENFCFYFACVDWKFTGI